MSGKEAHPVGICDEVRKEPVLAVRYAELDGLVPGDIAQGNGPTDRTRHTSFMRQRPRRSHGEAARAA